jgi:hypothetical protein
MRLKDMDPDFLMCRDLRHQWELKPAGLETDPTGGKDMLYRTCVCLRCGTERVELVNLQVWRVVSRWYSHPAGYQLTERVHFTEVRKASIQHQLARKDKRKEVRR